MESLFEEIVRMQKELNKLFEEAFRKGFRALPVKERIFQPLVDIKEKDKNIVVEVDMPGVEKEDIKITALDHNLEIKAERKREAKVERKGYYREERSYTGYYRTIPLPDYAQMDKIKAEYKNGVLRLTIPKTKKLTVKPKTIRIQ